MEGIAPADRRCTEAKHLKLALRNILRQRARSGLTLAAIAVGVASLVLSGGFVEDILVQLREATIRSQIGHLQVYRAGRFEGGSQHPFEFLIEEPQRVAQALNSLPGLVVQARRLGFTGLISSGRGELPVFGEGIEPDAEAKIGTAVSMLSGRELRASDRFSILVGEGVATAMNLQVGKSVNLLLTTPEGAFNVLDFEVVGIFRSLSKEYDARAVRIPLPAAQELSATEKVNAFVVLLADTSLTGEAATALRARLPVGYEVKTWEDLADFYRNTAALYERQFGFLQLIVLFMVLLGVANSVNMTLHERVVEFGTMRALGRTGRDVFRLAMLEMALMGIVGAALGVLLGSALAVGLSAVGIPMPPPPNSEAGFTAAIRLVPSVVALAFSAGVLASIGAALVPARRAARVPVADALRRAL